MGCILPKQSAEFVYPMEDVLEFSKRPYDPKRPIMCVDETFKQLIGETRQPLPMRPGRVERFDHVYTRNGVASLFVAFEPLRGGREMVVTDRRRRIEWAEFVRSLKALTKPPPGTGVEHLTGSPSWEGVTCHGTCSFTG